MKRLFYILLLLLVKGVSAQHAPLISQYMFNNNIINPACVGTTDALVASFLYRNQWVGIEGAPLTNYFSAHSPLRNNKVALGLSFLTEKIGVTNTNHAALYYAFRFRAGKGRVSLGLKAGMNMVKHNWNSLPVTMSQDPTFMNNESSAAPDVGLGLYYYSPAFFGGISVPSLPGLSQDEPVSGLSSTATTNVHVLAGAYLVNTQSFRMMPSVLLKYNQIASLQADINNFFVISDLFWIGGSYRLNDAFSAMLQFQANKQLRIGYAYDYSIGYLSKYNNGSHEIMLQYIFTYFVKASDPRFKGR